MAVKLSTSARWLGIFSAVGSVVLGLAYASTLAVGFLSLKSPQQPIGDPMFSILEVLIIVMMPVMVALMVAVHAWAPSHAKALSLTAVVFTGLLAGVTCSVHFVILTLSRQPAFAGQPWLPLLLSFKWPSVVYARHPRMGFVLRALDVVRCPSFWRKSARRIDPCAYGPKRSASARRFERCCDRRHATAEHRHRRLRRGVFVVACLLGILFIRSRPVAAPRGPDGR